MLTVLTPIRGVERTNTTIVNLNQQTGFMPRHNLHTVGIDIERNCYSCRSFRHLARNCRNQKVMKQKRRMEYEDNSGNRDNCNLNREESLIVLD